MEAQCRHTVVYTEAGEERRGEERRGEERREEETKINRQGRDINVSRGEYRREKEGREETGRNHASTSMLSLKRKIASRSVLVDLPGLPTSTTSSRRRRLRWEESSVA